MLQTKAFVSFISNFQLRYLDFHNFTRTVVGFLATQQNVIVVCLELFASLTTIHWHWFRTCGFNY